MKNEHVIGAVIVAFVLGVLIGREGTPPDPERPIVYEYNYSGVATPASAGSGNSGGTVATAQGGARTPVGSKNSGEAVSMAPAGVRTGSANLALGGSPAKGRKNAKVTIIESSDFQ